MDFHDTRDETLVTPQPVHVELSASAVAWADEKPYKAPLIVRVLRWFAAPFSESFDHDRRGTIDRRADYRRQGERRGTPRRGVLGYEHRKGDR